MCDIMTTAVISQAASFMQDVGIKILLSLLLGHSYRMFLDGMPGLLKYGNWKPSAESENHWSILPNILAPQDFGWRLFFQFCYILYNHLPKCPRQICAKIRPKWAEIILNSPNHQKGPWDAVSRAYERVVQEVVCTRAQGKKGVQKSKEGAQNFLGSYVFQSHPAAIPSQSVLAAKVCYRDNSCPRRSLGTMSYRMSSNPTLTRGLRNHWKPQVIPVQAGESRPMISLLFGQKLWDLFFWLEVATFLLICLINRN